jgi:hypothetical protein
MARAKFRTIIPKLLPKKVFDDAFEAAAREMEKDVKGAFDDATAFFKNKPIFRGYVRISGEEIYISVGTDSVPFRYYDLGNGGPGRIIRPVRASVLHWVDPSGEDVFVKWVRGYDGKKVSESIQAIWAGGLMADYFDRHIQQAIEESGHAI